MMVSTSRNIIWLYRPMTCMKESIFWDITSCSPLKVNRRFGETCRFHTQGRGISQARNALLVTCFRLVSYWAYSSTLKMGRHLPPKRRLTFSGLHILTHSLTHSWSWALLEKPPIVQPIKNFPAFYGTRRFNTVLTRAIQRSLSWARSIQSIPFIPSKIHFNIFHPPTSWSS
jgi:hypothetical protein